MNIMNKKPMTKAEMISLISENTGHGLTTIKQILENYEEVLWADLAESGETKLGKIGKIKIKQTASRTGINPLTREKVIIPSKIAPKFTFSKEWKEKIANNIKVVYSN